ncbi:serine/threonine-protein kinase [Fodinicola feengrottensis]|uniref:serine/threonine-protein kinase n=1 Tax=Fodinicola feengrottensis TaxID=435914 RepID=UPI00244336CE|nr:serine/threonine-protein kinase [Fodinicola feengrottensis]
MTTAHPGQRGSGNPPSERRIGGRYVLHATIGAGGGMGTVWRATDELLRREVAVKEVLLPPGLPAAERDMLCERTLREARSAAALNHPAVIRIFDVVDDDDSRPWIVMELLDARSLADVIREDGPLPPRTVAAIGLAVLGALEAAHTAGVLHRDIKPGNVMVAADGRTTLTDFGVASAPGDSSLTSTGLLLGSPQYIAPERARGQAFGPSSDLFSLGATLYAAVQGKPPFDRGDPLPTLTAVVSEDPDPMTLAGPLVPVLAGLLRKSPNDRFTHARARAGLLSILGAGLDSDTDSDAARRAALVAQTVQHTPAPLPGHQPSSDQVAAQVSGVPAASLTAPAAEPAGDATTMWMPLPTNQPAPDDEKTVPEPAAAEPVTEPEPVRHGAHEPGTHEAGAAVLGDREPDAQLPVAVSPGAVPVMPASAPPAMTPAALASAPADPTSGAAAMSGVTPASGAGHAAGTGYVSVAGYAPSGGDGYASAPASGYPSSGGGYPPASGAGSPAGQSSGAPAGAIWVGPAATTAMPALPGGQPAAAGQSAFSYGVAGTPAAAAQQPYADNYQQLYQQVGQPARPQQTTQVPYGTPPQPMSPPPLPQPAPPRSHRGRTPTGRPC